MDAIEVRMRCLELVARELSDPDGIIRAVQYLERFVMDAGVVTASETTDNGSSDNEAPTT
ncbi:MAG TPA: hypothetical protein VGC14_02565 [Rhizobium sp.]